MHHVLEERLQYKMKVDELEEEMQLLRERWVGAQWSSKKEEKVEKGGEKRKGWKPKKEDYVDRGKYLEMFLLQNISAVQERLTGSKSEESKYFLNVAPTHWEIY